MENSKRDILDSQLGDESEIKKFYAGKTILVTGSTGYMGKLIVEKILRSCPEIRKLYLIIRPKKEMGVDERLKKYFENPIFETMIGMHGNALHKVEAIEGDLMMPDIGLSPDDRHVLATETDIIIHNAAVTNFFAKLSVLLKVNVLGVKALLDFANDCKRLKTFLYVSTAFVHSYMQTLGDQIYPMPMDLSAIHDMLKADTDNASGLSKEAIKSLIGRWPNIYAFTKAFGEMLVDEYSKRSNYQCCIFRPSIVTCTWKEPVQGWIGNRGGAALPMIGNGLGVVRTCYIRSNESLIDVVPADQSVNCILAIIWYTAVHRKNIKGETMVFNYGTTVCNPYNFCRGIVTVTKCIRENPSRNALWYSSVILTNYTVIWYILLILLQVIPSIIVDAVLLLRGRKPFIMPLIRSHVEGLMAVLKFANTDIRIHVPNVKKMWESLNETDRELFQCDLRTIDWDAYSSLCWKGIKQHLLKEPAQATEKTKQRYFKLKVVHYCTVSFFSLLLAYFFCIMLSYICSFF